MGPFDIKKWLATDLAEDITYTKNCVGNVIRALVIREGCTQVPIQSLHNSLSAYPITIEVSLDDVPAVDDDKTYGDKVTLRNLKGKMETFPIAEVLGYDVLSNSFLLGISNA